MSKDQKGFTLIEVIVVAVIVAVLAAVAIPIYNGYIQSSRQNVVDNNAGALATFCAASRDQGTNATLNVPLVDGALNTTWQIPKGITVVVGASSVTVTHDKGKQNSTQNY